MKQWGLILLGVVVSTVASAKPVRYQSSYTALTGCQVVEQDDSDEGMGYVKERCNGYDGYDVFIESADGRSWLRLEKAGRVIDLQKAFLEAPFQFAVVDGKKVEWRFQVEGKTSSLRGLIVRMAGVDAVDPMKKREALLVMRIEPTGYCAMGYVATNAAAQKLADDQKNCSNTH